MKVLIVYDSYFGNTEKIARAMSNAFNQDDQIIIKRAADVQKEERENLDWLIVGSPTRGFNPTQAINDFIQELASVNLKDTKAIVFDTRADVKQINNGFLTVMVKLFGYAAKKMAFRLQKQGARLVLEPQGFFVKDQEGPLFEGEEERALKWLVSAMLK